MASEIVELILKAKDLASESINRLRSGMEKLRASAEKIRQTSQDMMDFGVKVGAMGAALAAMLAFPVKAAADFEQAMAEVGAIVDTNEEKFNKLKDAAIELGKATKFTSEEAAEGMKYLALAGFKTTEIIAAMPSVLQLAAAANLDLGSSADIVANILHGYGLQVSDLARSNDVLVKAFTNANTNLRDLGTAMKYVGPVAAAAGAEFEEVVAAVSKLSDAGLQSSMAGTSLRMVLSKLINPVGDAKKKFEELGIQVTDSHGKFIGFANIISQFEKAFANVSGEAQRAAIIMDIFGERGGPAMAALIEKGSDSIRNMTQLLRDSAGTAERISEKQLENLKGAFERLSGEVESLVISIGTPFLGALSKVFEWMEKFVAGLSKLKESLGPVGTIIFGIVGAIGALLVVAGGLSIALGAIGLVVVSLVNGFAAWSTIIPGLITGIKSVIANLAGLKTSLIATVSSAGVLNIALGVGLVGAAIAAGYGIGSLIEKLIWGKKRMDEFRESSERVARAQEDIAWKEAEISQTLTDLGITSGTLTMRWEQFNKEVKEGLIIWDEQEKAYRRVEKATQDQKKTYEELIDTLEVGSEKFLTIRNKELATLKATIDYEIALEEKRYKEGQTSYEEFLKFKERRQEDHVNRMLYLLDIELDELKKAPEENLAKIAELEEQKKQIILQSQTEQLQAQQELNSGLKEEYQKDIDNWKSLQELKLQSLQGQLDLQNTIEETMVQRGIMRQSELLENQMSRLREFYEEKIRMAEETMNKIVQLEGADTEEYRQAVADRERLQKELEAKIIQSEQQISEAREKEEIDALKFIEGITGDRVKLVVRETEDKIKELKKYYDQGLIEAQEYHDALEILERSQTSVFKAELKERCEQLNQWASMVSERMRKTQEIINNFMESTIKDAYADVKQWWGDAAFAMSRTTEQVVWEINHLTETLNGASYEVFWNASVFGKKMTQFVGETMYEWMDKVTGYINYVKGLLMSLQDYIASLRAQLMQLRGDRLGELEMWYEEEKKKLEDKYKDELGKTKEYYEALALLAEIYKEKKKKILEEMEEDEVEYEEKKEKRTGGAAGGAGGLAGIIKNLLPDMSGLTAGMATGLQLAEVKVSKEYKLDSIFEIKTYDIESTDRYIRDVFWPRFENHLKLKGIDLGKE